MCNAVYVVLEPIDIVATDLVLCLYDHNPSAAFLVAKDAKAALSYVEHSPTVSIAFIHDDPKGFATTPLGIALTEKRALCIFMGDRAERSALDVWLLERPFSAETIAAIMQRAAEHMAA